MTTNPLLRCWPLLVLLALGLPALLISQDVPPRPAAPADAAPDRVRPDAPRAAGTITSVALYQGSALVTRTVEVPAKAGGALELLVTHLPTATDTSSVFADRAQGVQIRSVACRQRPVEEADQLAGEVARLDKAMRDITRKISAARNEMALRRIRQDYLRGLENFVAPAAAQEMTHGVLQAEELQKVTTMHFTEYEAASQEIMKLDFECQDDTEELERLKKERAKLAAGPPVTYDAVVFLDREEGAVGPATFQLNYLVTDCGWSPVYNVRGDTAAEAIDLELGALIHQVSGEDWENTRLILSTASPTVSAYNPRLAPLYVRVTQPGESVPVRGSTSSNDNASRYGKAIAQKKEALKGQRLGKSIAESASANFVANESAASVQLIELSERMSELRHLSERSEEDDLSIQYTIARPVTLVSRREAQMVPVLQHRGEAQFYHVATPILTPSVFREAELTNATGQDLLGGRVNIYLDGEFTGRTDIPTIARGRNIALGFGVEGRLRARRVLTDRDESVQGGNRLVTISSEVILDNYKAEPVVVRVRERTPFTDDQTALRLSLGEMSQPLSADPDYRRFERPKGILLWDIEVAPGSGDEATSLSYAYALEFDKSLTLRETGTAEKSRARDEFLRESRKVMVK